MIYNGASKVKDILNAHPWLIDELAKIDGRAKMLKTPVGKMMIKNATVADAANMLNMPEGSLLEQLRQIFDAHK